MQGPLVLLLFSDICMVLLDGLLFRGRRIQGLHPRFGALAVLFAGAAGEPDSTYNLAIDGQRNTAFNRDCSFDAKNAKSRSTGCQRILKCLGRALEPGSGAGLADGDVGAAILGVIHLLVVDEGTVG